MNQTKEELLEQENQKLRDQVKDMENALLREKVTLFSKQIDDLRDIFRHSYII